MARPDFSIIDPPKEVMDAASWAAGWAEGWREATVVGYRAGAQYAAEQLKHTWPEPITDRPPTEKDADDDGMVQYVFKGYWHLCDWEAAARDNDPWLHAPNWQPKPPSEAHVIAAELRGRVPGDCIKPETLIRAAELLEALG